MLRLLMAGSVIALLGAAARGDFINGGFETGDFSGWSTIGLASIQTGSFGSGPVSGQYQALIESGDGVATATLADLEKFTGFSSQTLNDLSTGFIQNGSAIQQSFSGQAGQLLTFNWNFLTNEDIPSDPLHNDLAFITIDHAALLADTNNTFHSSTTLFAAETGFQTFSYLLPTSGTFTLSVGVVNVGDIFTGSGLLVDDFRLATVPEPSSFALGATGLALLALGRRHARPHRR